MTRGQLRHLERVNKELWILLSLFAIALLLNHVFASQQMVLGFYVLPTLGSAYLYGKRHATLTALASALMVVLLLMYGDTFYPERARLTGSAGLTKWLDVTVWGGSLLVTGYLMGSLCERKNAQVRELRETYHGVLMILRHFMSKDTYTAHHCQRVSAYAAIIAETLQLSADMIDDIKAAGMLHDIGKLDISRDILYKAARLTNEEYEEIKQHVTKGIQMLEPVGGSLRRVIPIILAHHDKFDGSGYHPTSGEQIPIESRIISVADVYDSLTSDRPYRKAMSPYDARDIIAKGAEAEFDPKVVNAFLKAFRQGKLEMWAAPVTAA
jgi:putative nucleotidyltransferase with HDIG domain